MTIAQRLREIGLTAEVMREMPPRHAALRDDVLALAVRFLRDSPAARLDIVDDLYLFSAPDEVLGPSETTAILYRAARQARASSVLDLGCGCGTLSLLLARGGALVVGTDINRRAVDLCRWNAEVNGIEGVEFRVGSLFEPVRGDRFDLIVSQPPYIPRIAGSAANAYYHAGERGDELAREIVAHAAEHLTDEGRALVFSDWPLVAGESLRDRVPHEKARVIVFASPPVAPGTYYAPQAADVAAVHNCLVAVQAGEGYSEREVLPHEWAGIDIESIR